MGKQIRKLQTFGFWMKLQWIWACWQGISKVLAVGSTLEAYGLSWKHYWVHPWQSDTRLKIEPFSRCNMAAWKNIRYFPSKILPKKSNVSKHLNGTAPPLCLMWYRTLVVWALPPFGRIKQQNCKIRLKIIRIPTLCCQKIWKFGKE